MIHSATADKYDIYNIPNKYITSQLTSLCTHILEPIRKKYNKPIIITSGYRSDQLNKRIGGAKNSDHVYGQACDCIAQDGDNLALWNTIIKLVKEGKLSCRQIIWEKTIIRNGKKMPKWIHISQNHKYNSYKNNQILVIE